MDTRRDMAVVSNGVWVMAIQACTLQLHVALQSKQAPACVTAAANHPVRRRITLDHIHLQRCTERRRLQRRISTIARQIWVIIRAPHSDFQRPVPLRRDLAGTGRYTDTLNSCLHRYFTHYPTRSRQLGLCTSRQVTHRNTGRIARSPASDA